MGYELGPALYLVAGLHDGEAQVNTSVGADDTTIPYANETGEWPSCGLIKLEDEYILYRAINETDKKLLNCVRGFYSTTAAAHDGSGTPISFSVLYSDLGKTHGGGTIAFGEETTELTTDQDGATPVDIVATGVSATITMNLADITLDNFAFVHKTSVSGTSPNRRVVVPTASGCSTLGNAKKILVVPYGCSDGYVGPTKESEGTYFIPSGGIVAKEELSFNASDQRVIAVEIHAYPDDTVGGPVVIGDATDWL